MKNVKVWPPYWSNRIEIISIPFAFQENGNWFLKVHYLDLEEKVINNKHCSLPLRMAPYLKIGVEIGKDFVYKKESGETKWLTIDNFKDGTIEVLKSLDKSIYNFNTERELYDETRFFKIILQGETYLFFCYELYRRFQLNNSFLSAYTMKPQELSLLIDNYKITKTAANESKLELFFNNEVPIGKFSLGFIQQFTLIEFHPQLKQFLSNVLKAQERPYSKNHFHFSSTFLPSLEMKCRFKRVGDFNVVFEIKDIRGIQLLFDTIDASHPKCKNTITERPIKQQSIPTTDPANYEVNYDGEGYNPSKGSKTTYIDGFSLKLGNHTKIRRLETGSGSANTAKQKVKLPDSDETEQLSLNGPSFGSDKTQLNIETTDKIQIINPEDIPEGLREFAKSIERVTAALKTSFTYTLIELPGTSRCSCIQNQQRKVMVTEFELSSKFCSIFEADPNDNKPLSTLIIRSNKSVEQSEIVNEIPACGCTWSIQYLKDKKLAYKKLKHPYIRTKEPPLTETQKTEYKIARHAANILSVLNDLYSISK